MFLRKTGGFSLLAAATCLRWFLKEIFQLACIGRSTNDVAYLVHVCDFSLVILAA